MEEEEREEWVLFRSGESSPRSDSSVVREPDRSEDAAEAQDVSVEAMLRSRTPTQAKGYPKKAEAYVSKHNAGTCTPCIYFRFTRGGCRQAEHCRFCHICSYQEAHERLNPHPKKSPCRSDTSQEMKGTSRESRNRNY
mmetsp:Transcript_82873/g.146446  ORF Transcript_82873/g.146446 Transcript_82873/m.146446 type:complete len:138 (+) Transcript_82873:127-540(+)